MSLFYNFNESKVVENVTMKWPSDEYIIPAGTPMSRTGIANNGDAIGILARDAKLEFRYPLSVANLIGKKEPKGNDDFTFAIITGGFVNLFEAEEAFGGKISDEAKSAMTNINFVDDKAPNSFGGSGGGASGGGVTYDAILDFGDQTVPIYDGGFNASKWNLIGTTFEQLFTDLKNGEFKKILVKYTFTYGDYVYYKFSEVISVSCHDETNGDYIIFAIIANNGGVNQVGSIYLRENNACEVYFE